MPSISGFGFESTAVRSAIEGKKKKIFWNFFFF